MTAPMMNATPHRPKTAAARCKPRLRVGGGARRAGRSRRSRCAGRPPPGDLSRVLKFTWRVACAPAAVTLIDWIIIVLTLATAAAGFFQGFVVGVATLAGFAGGLLVGARVGQALVASGSHSPYAPLFGLIGALIGGLLFGSLFEALGHGLRRRFTTPSLGLVDGLAGALLSAAVALGVVWLAGAVALQSPQTRGLRS